MNSRVSLSLLIPLAVALSARAQTEPVPRPGAATAAPPPAMTVESAPTIMLQPATVLENGGGPVCGPAGRVWAKGEFLLWWLRGSPLPALVTTSPAGTARETAGNLDNPNTRILFGDSLVNPGVRPGGRVALGFWFDPQQTFGVEANLLVVGGLAQHFSAASDGSQIIARPFFNALLSRQDTELVSFPGVLSGGVTASASSSGLIGTEVNFLENLGCQPWCRVDVLLGYRRLQNDDRLRISENLVSIEANNRFGVPVGTRINVTDDFVAKNQFDGGNFGLVSEFWRERWTLNVVTKLAVGYNHQVVDISGGTDTTVPGQATARNVGGLLAQQTNIGHFDRSMIGLLPEFGVNLGYQINPNIRVYTGYTFLLWSNVAKVGDQIDTILNPNNFPPSTNSNLRPRVPIFPANESDLWAQGITFGLQIQY